MSKYPSGDGKTKSKKPFIGRNRSPKCVAEEGRGSQYGSVYMNDNLPDACRKKLNELFSQIEKEFERVCLENQTRMCISLVIFYLLLFITFHIFKYI